METFPHPCARKSSANFGSRLANEFSPPSHTGQKPFPTREAAFVFGCTVFVEASMSKGQKSHVRKRMSHTLLNRLWQPHSPTTSIPNTPLIDTHEHTTADKEEASPLSALVQPLAEL